MQQLQEHGSNNRGQGIRTGNSHGHADGFSDGEVRGGRVVAVLSAHLGNVTHDDAQLFVEQLVVLKNTKKINIQNGCMLE